MSKLIDLTGKTFGRLVVIERAPTIYYNRGSAVPWLCRCSCGNEKLILGGCLARGGTISCGCFLNEHRGQHRLTHGYASKKVRSSEYHTWCSMKGRCLNKDDAAYPNYGGRGIAISKEWAESFLSFLKDMGPRPPNTSLDRIDNNKGYFPGNCRWASRVIQNRNTRRNTMITVRGVTLSLPEWAERTGIKNATIQARLYAGWTAEKSIDTPTRKINITGQIQT